MTREQEILLKMAKKALSADTSSDLISRADAIDALYAYQDAVRIIKALPSADAVSREECDECKTDKEGVLLQQLAELRGDYETMKNAYEDALADAVHGEWIFNPTDAIDLMFAKPKCSKCGFESSDGGNFCPNCGARMKGGDDE